jgi:hypothetical protein
MDGDMLMNGYEASSSLIVNSFHLSRVHGGRARVAKLTNKDKASS